ncbi:MAG: ABC transporter ATP-binding protein [Paenibacillaceae bacterium]
MEQDKEILRDKIISVDKGTIRRLFRYALLFKFRIIAAILILIMAVGTELLGPIITRTVINDHLSLIGSDAFRMKPIIYLVGLYVCILVGAAILHFVQSFLLQTTALRIILQMRMDIMNHLQRIAVRYFDNTPVGALVNRVANDTESIRDLYMSFMATFVVSLVQITGIFIFLFYLNPFMASICLILIPFYAGIVYCLLRFSNKYWVSMRARISEMNAMLSETIVVMPVLRLFRREKETVREFEELNDVWFVNNVKQLRLTSMISRNLIGLSGALMTAFIIYYFGGLSLEASIELGTLYAFLDYLGRLFYPVIGIFDQLVNAQRAFVSAERVFELMDEPGREVTDIQNEQFVRPKGTVTFEDIWFAYNDEEYVLKGLSFEAIQGQTVALVGHTGSGKSSVMNLLLGFYETEKGKITIDGQDIRTIPKQSLRKYMAVVLQDPFLFAGDIKFNVSLYNKSIGPDQVSQALKDVGADTFVERLPAGMDEPVIERGSTLSAGQRQLITFARALAFNPSILILDEATASIDSETEGLIQNALKVLSQGRTTFVIAHRLSTIREADLILVLHKGEIVERGSHEELMQAQGRYYKMYELQKGA